MFAIRRAIRVAPRQAPRFAYASRPFAPRFYASESTAQPAAIPPELGGQPAAEPSKAESPEAEASNTETPAAQSNGNGASGGNSSKTNGQAKAPVQYAKSKPPYKPQPLQQVRKELKDQVKQENARESEHPQPSTPSNFQQETIAYGNPNWHATKEDRDVDWENSFHGISIRPVNKDQFDVLMRPIDIKDIEVKPDGVIYLPEIKYRRRLNEAFGPMGWGLIPRGATVVGQSIVTREYALIVDGRFVSQAQGENNYFSPEQLPSAVEGCKSNALMRCCKDLGIGSDLWDPAFVRWFKKTHMQEVWVEHATTKKKRTLWFKKSAVEVVYPWKRV